MPLIGPDLIMLIRHGEKPGKAVPPHGLDENGELDDKHSLSRLGWTRAGALIGYFSKPIAPIQKPTHLFAASGGLDDSPHGRRPMQTLLPLAGAMSKHLHANVAVGDEDDLAREILKKDGVVLVCWEHVALTAIVNCIGNELAAAPLSQFARQYDGSRYDIVWTLTKAGSTYDFAIAHEALLDGDADVP